MSKPQRDMSGNLVVNGSFEEPREQHGHGHARGIPAGSSDLTGWTISGGGIDVLGDHADRRVNLGGATTISQKLSLIPGTRYQVSFVVTNAGSNDLPRTGVVRIAGQVFPFSHTPAKVVGDRIWSTFEFDFSATGPTTLEICSTYGEEHGPHIGDVLVAQHGPRPPAISEGTVVSVQGDEVVIDVRVMLDGKPIKVHTKYFLQKSTRCAPNWKPTPGAEVTVQFERASDGRRMLESIAPR